MIFYICKKKFMKRTINFMKNKKIIIVSCFLFVVAINYSLFAQAQVSSVFEQAQIVREEFVKEAKKYLGTPYKYAGTDPSGFDCSGFVSYVAEKSCDVTLPRRSQDIFNATSYVMNQNREIGDLLFFKTTNGDNISHVGIYIGNDEFIHSASDGPVTGVIISSLSEKYYKRTYYQAGRFLPSAVSKGGTFSGLAGSKSSDGTKNFRSDTIATFNWSFLDANRATFSVRGFSITEYISYRGWAVAPGIGITLRYNAPSKTWQFPITIGVDFIEYIRVYIGLLFSTKGNKAPGTDLPLDTSVFPGIIGLQFHSPALKLGSFQFKLVQSLNYTFYKIPSESSLSSKNLFNSSFELSTGLCVTLPF